MLFFCHWSNFCIKTTFGTDKVNLGFPDWNVKSVVLSTAKMILFLHLSLYFLIERISVWIFEYCVRTAHEIGSRFLSKRIHRCNISHVFILQASDSQNNIFLLHLVTPNYFSRTKSRECIAPLNSL